VHVSNLAVAATATPDHVERFGVSMIVEATDTDVGAALHAWTTRQVKLADRGADHFDSALLLTILRTPHVNAAALMFPERLGFELLGFVGFVVCHGVFSRR
jgi:hypothetical protein